MKKQSKKRLKGSSGFTIIEVLIASTVFVLAFTVMVSLLDTTINRFSNKDLITGTNLASEIMALALTTHDTTSFDSLMTRGGVSYLISKKTELNDGLYQVQILVKRAKTGRKIISLYNEFLETKKK